MQSARVKQRLCTYCICREGTEDTKFKLTKKKKFESKSHPWIPTPEMKTIREFIEKIQDDYPEASIEIVPLSCEEGKYGLEI